MPDIQEKIGHSLIQHGDSNRRVYLMKLDHRDRSRIITDIEKLARKNRYGKIFCKVPEWARSLFEKHHYRMRAHVPGFYQGKNDLFFMSKFMNLERKHLPGSTENTILENLKLARAKAAQCNSVRTPEGYQIKKLNNRHIQELSLLYQATYISYPFPITDPEYLKATMHSHIDYFGCLFEDRLVAAASAEKDSSACNAEMTDFATDPDHRGRGLATALLMKMEQAMKKQNILTLFTIARALSPGINITFAKCGYQYSGTLINNTQISGNIESMNVWYKRL